MPRTNNTLVLACCTTSIQHERPLTGYITLASTPYYSYIHTIHPLIQWIIDLRY